MKGTVGVRVEQHYYEMSLMKAGVSDGITFADYPSAIAAVLGAASPYTGDKAVAESSLLRGHWTDTGNRVWVRLSRVGVE